MKPQLYLTACMRCGPVYLCPLIKKITTIVLVLLALLIICLGVPSLRNAVLFPVWPHAWRGIGTVDILSIKLFSPTTYDLPPTPECSGTVKPSVTLSDIDTTKVNFYPELSKQEILHAEHQRFLPLITNEEKLRMLHIYTIVADVLKKGNVEFFFVEGSLLGVHRHHGLVPWDDDIDIAINVTQWEKVRDLLSCIEGYTLNVLPKMHWKFYSNSSHFPFIDIFFYTENKQYIWAVTYYLTQTVFFDKNDTFPLTTAQFEGLTVNVPKNTDLALRKVFDYEKCQSPSTNHKTAVSVPDSEMSIIKCSSLTYLYDMYHLKY